MADVFVSYKTDDRRRVAPLVEALRADGYSVWWDEQISGGSAWRHEIEAELKTAKCVIVVWSNHSVGPEGAFVQDEAARAQERHVYLPVTIDNVQVPLGFGETQALSLSGWNGKRSHQNYQAVLAVVSKNVDASSPPLTASRSQIRLHRRAVLGAGSIGLVVLAGTGGWLLLRPRAAETSDSIAVLPFDNLSGDPTQAYFSDGMAEELRSVMTRIPQLKVVARTSSEAVRNDDARTAARKLGVANILTGSIRRSGRVIRISTQLVDGRTGLERWSEQFDEPIGDTLEIQGSIAERVAAALQIQLGKDVRDALSLGGTNNPAAHDHFLKANLGRKNDSAEGMQAAIAQLDAAIELDPNYVDAYAGKATLLASYGANWARSTSELALDLSEAVSSARRAISLAPHFALGHSALGYAYKLQLKFKDALREMQAAVALPGADAGTFGRYALLLVQIGRGDQADKAMARAISLDPLNYGPYGNQAVLLFQTRRFPDAEAAARHSLQLNPSGTFVKGILAYSLILMGRDREAIAEFGQMPVDSFQVLAGRGIIAARKGDSKGVDEAVRQLRVTYGDSVNYELAQVYAQARRTDAAIAYLRKPESQRDPGFIFIAGDPFLDPIRGDPRFKEIVRQMDFPRLP